MLSGQTGANAFFKSEAEPAPVLRQGKAYPESAVARFRHPPPLARHAAGDPPVVRCRGETAGKLQVLRRGVAGAGHAGRGYRRQLLAHVERPRLAIPLMAARNRSRVLQRRRFAGRPARPAVGDIAHPLHAGLVRQPRGPRPGAALGRRVPVPTNPGRAVTVRPSPAGRKTPSTGATPYRGEPLSATQTPDAL